MKNTIHARFLKSAVLGIAGLLLSAVSSYAQLFQVSINTTALTQPANSASAPFSLDFQLNSGNTLNNNTAILSNFSFGGGGAPFGAPNVFGGAGGSLPGIITLTDTFAFNEFFQEFTPGSILQFDLFLSQNVDAGPTPDGFSIAILDSALFNLPTTGFANQLLSVDIMGASPTIQTFQGIGSFAGVTLSITPVPEPSTYAIVGAMVLVGIVLRRRYAAKTAAL